MKTGLLRGTVLLATITGLALAAGCSDGPGAAGPPRVEKPDLNVAVVPALDSAGFFVALYQGLFRAQGLNVHFTPAVSSETVIDQQALGQFDITAGNYVSYIQAQRNWNIGERPSPSHPGIVAGNLDIFAEGSVLGPGAQAIYTTPDSGIRTVAGLKGHTVAVNAPKNILYLLASSILRQQGISAKSVHFVSVPLPEMPAELKAGTISAAVLPEPFASEAEVSDGAAPLIDMDQGATTDLPVEGYVVTKQWAQRYPRTLSAFYKALEQGQQIADTRRAAVEQAMQELPKPLGVSREIAALMALDSYPVSTGPVGSVDQVRLQRVVDIMQQFLSYPPFRIATMLINGPGSPRLRRSCPEGQTA